MKKQTTIPNFEKTYTPRLKRMHFCDVGTGDCIGEDILVIFKCSRCGHQSEWMVINSVSDVKRGLPCPICNKGIAYDD
jgi:DNA-directed RNA polymerase subunit RPC12/RpoP